jgi:hypothetical protein
MGLKGYRLWAMGQLDSTCRAPPRSCSGTGSSPGPGPRLATVVALSLHTCSAAKRPKISANTHPCSVM